MDTFRGADKKLGELMLRGWTMLADSCTVPTCNCPLMRNPDGQKYCVICEEWIYDNKKREQKKYSELFPSRISQNYQENQHKKEIPKKIEKQDNKVNKKNNIEEEKTQNNQQKIIPNKTSFIDLLNNKLNILAKNLNEESDIKKCNEIIDLMNKIIDLIKNYKAII